MGQGLDGGATVSQGPGKGNSCCASGALAGVSLASVETGLSRMPQGSRKCCIACEGAPCPARNFGAFSFCFFLCFPCKLGLVN